jgi:type II secretory pathway pseudopilin PulG
MRKGFALIEVIIATGLVLLVGAGLTTLLIRSETTARTSEAAEAATLFARTMVLQVRDAPPRWLPSRDNSTVTLTQDQIADILGRMPRVTFSSPDLYEVEVTRTSTAGGLANFAARVCVRQGRQPVCVTANFHAPASSAYVPPSEGAPTPPPSGRAVVTLSITGPDGGAADVTLSDQNGPIRTYTSYGVYTQEVTPGGVWITARNTANNRYTYLADPRSVATTLIAGTSRSISVAYTCATGAADFTVVPPRGQSLPSGTVTLQPGNTDVSRGGLVPYLPPRQYTVNARDVRSGSYTYSARVSPSSSFTVVPCQTQSLTVAYEAVTGALRVEISKPQGMSAAPQVRVTGPDPSLPRTLTETTTLQNLVPGQYGVSPQDVLDDGVRFRGTASPANPTVQAEQTATSQVAYAPVSAKLTVVLRAGGQNYPSPQVSLQGPGLNQVLTAYSTYAFSDRTPGDYTLRASPVQDGLYTYAPSPLNQTVTLVAGDRKTVTLTYGPTTGALRVSVTGLPQGATPRVFLNGNALTFDSAGQATVPYLTPGSHTLTAENVSHGGYVYAPSPANASVSVQAGSLATETITYTRLEGTVTVTVSGLPSGVAPDATLTLPNGSTRAITQSGTTTFTGMPTGRYTLTARDVTSGGITYRATVSPTSGNLANGGSLNFIVSYEAQNGILDVQISGLPSGVNANVSVTGPSGYARTLTRGERLRVPPGSYTVSAQPVTANLQTPHGALIYTFNPSPSTPQTVEVRAGATTTVGITYAKASGNVSLTVRNPSSANAQVTLTGPGGFSKAITAPPGTSTHAYDDIPAGEYTASGRDIVSGGYTYRAAPVTGTLNTGGTLSLTLSYTAATGALEVRVTAPQGMPAPTVRLLNSQGGEVGRFTGTSHTFTNLLPGTYRVAPDPVTDNAGFAYRADPVSVSVTAGQTASTSVSYVKQSAFVQVNVSGLPPGASPSVTLSGPRTVTLNAPGTVELPLGAYTVSVGTVTHGGYQYVGSASPSSFSLSVPGGQQTVNVSYQEASGTVSLQVSGLPQGASVSLTLRSVAGDPVYTRTCGNGPCNFNRIPTGTYTLTAPNYANELYDYAPTVNPTQYNLTSSGQTLRGTVTYTPTTGAVQVTVSGPPSMPSPTLTLRDSQGNAVATYRGTGTFTTGRLRPGTYTLVASPVTDGSGFAYAPSPSSVSLTVTAGQTASTSVSYVRQGGTLRLSISGLPSGATARVNISGPVNRTVSVGNTSGYDVVLPPGTYTVTPEDYRPNSIRTYKASPSTVTVTVDNGALTTASFTYTLQRGALRVAVTGLPSGASVTVTVSGPDYNRSFTSGNNTHTLRDLLPGNYTVRGSNYRSGCAIYRSTAVTATVTSGETTDAFLRYEMDDSLCEPPPPRDCDFPRICEPAPPETFRGGSQPPSPPSSPPPTPRCRFFGLICR